MMSKTHLAVGVAASVAVTMPESIGGLFTAVIGGCVGGILCDIECKSTPEMRDALHGRLIAAGIVAILLILDKIINSGIWNRILSQDSFSLVLGAIVLIIVTASLVWNFFFKPREDCGIISIGNFDNNPQYYDGVVKEIGFKYPNLSTFCYVAVSEKDQQADSYTNQAAVATLYSGANVIVTDQSAMPYFFEYLTDCSDLYKNLEQTLPADKYAKIKPLYMSEREYKKLIVEYRIGKGMELADTNVDLSTFSDAKIMTGLLIEDADMIKKLGYTNYWPDKPATVVFGINVLSRDQDESKRIITAVLQDL